jgi:putative PIN family toxin of toxin-antitoxin system
LWRDHRELQLVVSDETVAEYFEVLQRHGVSERRIRHLDKRLRRRETVTHVGLGARPTASRDPDDNVVLAAAVAGKVKFLITNDNDLLDLPEGERKKFKFTILSPSEFLARIRSSN